MFEPKRRKVRDYSNFDQMSTEMLKEILKRDFERSDGEESDTEAILHIMEVIAERERQSPQKAHPTAEQAWERFEQYYRPSPGEGSLYEDDGDDEIGAVESEMADCQTYTLKKIRRPLRCLTGVAAAFLVVIGGGAITEQALGYHLWDVIVQWTSQTLWFEERQTCGTLENDQLEVYTSLQAALDDYHITEDVVPTWIPEGYGLASVEVSQYSSNLLISGNYANGSDWIIIAINHITDGNYSSFEKEQKNVEIYEENEIKHYLLTNLGFETAVWMNESNECSIRGTVSKNELKEMIQSVYK